MLVAVVPVPVPVLAVLAVLVVLKLPRRLRARMPGIYVWGKTATWCAPLA